MTTNTEELVIGHRPNICHQIDPSLVQAQTEKQVAIYERDRIRWKEIRRETCEKYEVAKSDGTATRWLKPPETPGCVDPLVDAMIAREQSYYSLVRVIEIPCEGKRFVLVYGAVDDATVVSGTGPFESVAAASNWFLGSGR